MKRFHVHLHVQDLQASIAFYSRLFSAEPTRIESGYAKWMLEDPRVNFAISTRGNKPGLDHLGFQVDSAEELSEMKAVAQSADMTMLDEGETTCCYARSEKHWITDPQGIAWEHFHTLGDIPVFNEAGQSESVAACCAPAQPEVASCCTPQSTATASCCSPTSSKTSCC
jgi:catechol 2,3-dioxygenase-like lactoylglutathione lyase family enzyme